MDRLRGKDGLTSPDMIRARVLKDAQRSLGGVAPADLERCVQIAVSNLWTERTRVTSFIPVLALRDVREMLERQAAGGLA